MTKQDAKKIREYVLCSRDVEKVRVTRDGGVHALGTMPNTNKRGWYFYGEDFEILKRMEHELA